MLDTKIPQLTHTECLPTLLSEILSRSFVVPLRLNLEVKYTWKVFRATFIYARSFPAKYSKIR